MNIKPVFPLAVALLFAAQTFGQKTETRSLGNFSTVAISGGFDKVKLVQGSSNSAKISADGIALDKVETEVNNGTLEIGLKNGSNYRGKVELEISFTAIDEVNNSGSTDIVIEKLRADRFEFNGSGSGDLTGDFEVKKLALNISGSADSNLKGRADEQSINISGSGDVDASKLVGNKADVAISGSGDVRLNVERVRSSVSGSGDIENVHR